MFLYQENLDQKILNIQLVMLFKKVNCFLSVYLFSLFFLKDIISGTLSVRENLMFSANVRLQRTKTKDQRIEIVNRILHDLGLEKCADTRIGTHFIRGVSGGEKRRACIGMELVLSPTILFLDEPTSGKIFFIFK